MDANRDGRGLSRRTLLKLGVVGAAGSTLRLFDRAAWPLERLAHSTPSGLPEIQFALGDYIGPAETIEGVRFRFGPVFTKFVTARLTRTPTPADQRILADALDTIEDNYEFGPDGVFVITSYGLPYFDRLDPELVADHMPRLEDDGDRFALEEAEPSPTDVSDDNPDVTKERFEVPVRIEQNDLLFTIRSDDLEIATAVEDWLAGSNRLGGRTVPSPDVGDLLDLNEGRVMFVQRGMPRRLADEAELVFADRIHPESPMWMGFADQQVSGSGPPEITTFDGTSSARFTTTRSDDYFSGGSVQHLSHVILDLEQFYLGEADAEEEEDEDEFFVERVQYMFRSTPPPSEGFEDQFTDGGGPAFLPNAFHGVDDAERGARGIGTPEGERRIGHVTALQRSSRAADGTPVHVRVDGPGFDDFDVPDGSRQPKLQFSIFVPTAKFFADMRRNQAAQDLVERHEVPEEDNGLERFLTATRRQNFLVPPRRHRAFPLVDEGPVTSEPEAPPRPTGGRPPPTPAPRRPRTPRP